MIALLAEGVVRWYVNGKLQARYDSLTLSPFFSQGVHWVPFIGMKDPQDTLIWQSGTDI